MKVKVKFFGSLREFAKRKEIVLDIERHKSLVVIRDIVENLSEAINKELPQKIFDLWMRNSSLLILLNGINIRHLKEFDTPVKDGDEVAIFPPGAGG